MDSKESLNKTGYQRILDFEDEEVGVEMRPQPSRRRWSCVLLFGYIVLAIWTTALGAWQLKNCTTYQAIYCKLSI
jgi:hypothetical protein